MTQEIFTVNAQIIDANGTFNSLSGYPKAYKSTAYNNDIEKARQRALGDFHDVMGAFGNRDDRLIQMAFVMQMSTGLIIAIDKFGKLPALPDPPDPDEEE